MRYAKALVLVLVHVLVLETSARADDTDPPADSEVESGTEVEGMAGMGSDHDEVANHLFDLVSWRLRHLQCSSEEIDAFAIVPINRRGTDLADIVVVVIQGLTRNACSVGDT